MTGYRDTFDSSTSNGIRIHREYKIIPTGNSSSRRTGCSKVYHYVPLPYTTDLDNFVQIHRQLFELTYWKRDMQTDRQTDRQTGRQ